MKRTPFRIVLWGIGKVYNTHINILKMWENQKQIEVVGVTAKNMPNIKKLDGWKVVHKEALLKMDFDYIVVCSETNMAAITTIALSMGIGRGRLIPCRVLDIPYFDWRRYIHIIESRLSIISCNCWGGTVYNTLGMECLSPFKNLWINAEDMIHMVSNLKNYMEKELIFARWDVDIHSMQRYPVMMLGDIEVHFNHDINIEEALSKWERRKSKINYDNLLFMIYTENESTVEKFIQLDAYRKICFVPWNMGRLDNKDVWRMNLLPEQKEFYECVNAAVGYGSNALAFDVLQMIEGSKSYRYE